MASDQQIAELKPCPFCAADARLVRLGGEGSTHAWIQCTRNSCGASQGTKHTFETAIAAWNTRAAESAQAKERE
jgi:Lar family restriction alleviation protein